MKYLVIKVEPGQVTVLDPANIPLDVPVQLTPVTRKLTKDAQRRLLASGFLHHVSETWEVDPDLIASFMYRLGNRLASLETEAQS